MSNRKEISGGRAIVEWTTTTVVSFNKTYTRGPNGTYAHSDLIIKDDETGLEKSFKMGDVAWREGQKVIFVSCLSGENENKKDRKVLALLNYSNREERFFGSISEYFKPEVKTKKIAIWLFLIFPIIAAVYSMWYTFDSMLTVSYVAGALVVGIIIYRIIKKNATNNASKTGSSEANKWWETFLKEINFERLKE